jgi:hypothetical protein
MSRSRVRRIYRHGKWIEVETVIPSTPVRRKVAKLTKSWAQIPHERGLKIAKQAGNPILAVLLALEAAIHEARSNRVKLTNDLLEQYEITPSPKPGDSDRLLPRGRSRLSGVTGRRCHQRLCITGIPKTVN